MKFARAIVRIPNPLSKYKKQSIKIRTNKTMNEKTNYYRRFLLLLLMWTVLLAPLSHATLPPIIYYSVTIRSFLEQACTFNEFRSLV